MLRDITIGQYYPADSSIHRLDPRVKLAGTVLYLISLFLFSSVAVYIVATIYLGILIWKSNVPLKHIAKGLKPVVFLIVFTALLNLFTSPGEDVIWSFWRFAITTTGIKKAFFMVVRLIYLIIGSSLMTFTTTPNQLTDGIEKALHPLNRLKVPVHEFALMMSLALRFIPILMEEADKIIKAQSSRGADFEEGSLLTRAKNMVSILVPLLISATRRANDLAMAMDSRCYHGGEGRTKMKPLKYKRKDLLAYLYLFCYIACIVIAGQINYFGKIW